MKTQDDSETGVVIYLEDISDDLLNKALETCEKEDPRILSKTQSYVDKWIRINDHNPSDEEKSKRKKKFNRNVLPKIQERLNKKKVVTFKKED